MHYFPNIEGYLSSDPKKPEMHYAAVLNGRLQATNGHIACYISAEVFCKDPEQLKKLEGKLLTANDLRILTGLAVLNVEFLESGFIAQAETGRISRDYAGVVDKKTLRISLYDDIMDDYMEKPYKFPDLPAVIHAVGEDGQPDIKKIQTRNTHFRSVGIAANYLSIIAGSFEIKSPAHLRLEFFHAQAAKDRVEKPSAAILVSPFKSNHGSYKEMAVLMPVL